jgi:hypothetical protein
MVPSLTVASRMLAATLALAGMLAAPIVTSAQSLPSYARPAAPERHDETIHGRIASIDSTFHIRVNDERGFVSAVELHQGTIINPTGVTLAPGMSVTIYGYPSGSYFVAHEIDTPYQYSGPAPAPAYYGPGWWYPGFAYGYGPAFSLSLVFTNGYYGYVHRPFYGFGYGWYGHPWRAYPVAYRGGYYGAPYYRGAYYGAPYYRGGYYGAPYYRGGYYGAPYRGGYYGGPYYRGGYHGGGVRVGVGYYHGGYPGGVHVGVRARF